MRRGSIRAIHPPMRRRMRSATGRGYRARTPWRTAATAGRRRVEQWPTGGGCERTKANWIQAQDNHPVSTCVPCTVDPSLRLGSACRAHAAAVRRALVRQHVSAAADATAILFSAPPALPAHNPALRVLPLCPPSLSSAAAAVQCCPLSAKLPWALGQTAKRTQSSRREGASRAAGRGRGRRA
jgi:hypothetical protein